MITNFFLIFALGFILGVTSTVILSIAILKLVDSIKQTVVNELNSVGVKNASDR